MWKYGQEGFFCLTDVESKHQRDEHNQTGTNDFQRLIWIFWVCWLSLMWYNVDCSQLMSQFDRYQLQLIYPTMQHCPLRNLQHETSQSTFDTFNQSQHLLHTLHKSSLAFQLHFTLLEIIKHNMPKMLLFSFHLQYLNGYTKVHQFWCFFLMHADMTAVIYYLTKLFWMKLRTTKCY